MVLQFKGSIICPWELTSKTKACSESVDCQMYTIYVSSRGQRSSCQHTHTHTHTHNTCENQVECLYLKGTGREMRIPTSKGFCFFKKSEFWKDVLIKLGFSNLTAYVIKKPHLSHFQGKISSNSQLTEDNLLLLLLLSCFSRVWLCVTS